MDTQEEKSCLYVGNIPYKASKGDLRQHMIEYGPIESIKLFQRSGYGFVTFVNKSDADRCLEEMNGTKFMGRELKVSVSKYGYKKTEAGPGTRKCSESNRIYVGNIAYECDEKQIKEYFNKYGEVQEVQLVTRRNNSKGAQSRGFAFVTFENFAQAQKAIKEGHRAELCGRQLKVSGAHDKVDYVKAREESARYQQYWYWHMYHMYQCYKEWNQPAAGIYPPLRDINDNSMPSFGLAPRTDGPTNNSTPFKKNKGKRKQKKVNFKLQTKKTM